MADTRSFSAAAREGASSPSAVTRQIAQLEEHFGVRLFHRSTRHLTLTDDGGILLDHARHLIDESGAIEELLGQYRSEPVGVVRFGLSNSAAHFLGPRLPALLARHPGLTVELHVSDQRVDLIESRIDVAMRAGAIEDSSLIARRIGTTSPIPVAAPAYLQRAGYPRRPEDLADHVCIRSNRSSVTTPEWHLIGPEGDVRVRAHGPLTVNNIEITSQLALAGHGIAMLPIFMAVDHIRDGRLVRVLPDYCTPGLPIHLVYLTRRNLPLRTRVLMDFVMEQFKEALGQNDVA